MMTAAAMEGAVLVVMNESWNGISAAAVAAAPWTASMGDEQVLVLEESRRQI